MLRFFRIVEEVTRKDWLDHHTSIMVLSLLMALSVALMSQDPDTAAFGEGSAGAALLVMSFLFARVFHAERARQTLDFDFILAKYLSMYSMVLFTINVPGVFLRDWRLLLRTNGL